MTGTTWRLRRTAAIVCIGLATAAVVTGTALAADDGGHGVHDGKVTRGPVAISHGGQGKETPTGTFRVLWKDQNHKSAEFNDAPMPYSVFFADGGIAFHQGNPNNA